MFAVLGAIALVWILGTVPSGGPDEPAHLVRSSALVRGELDGEPFPGPERAFDLPAWIGHPTTRCFELQELQPASCATALPRPTGDGELLTTAWRYPVWGHLAPGLGSFFPAVIGNQMARAFDAIMPIGLLVASLVVARRRGPTATASVALAVTPMAWFSIIVVNPSGLTIAGGLALWVALLHIGWAARERVPPGDLAAWLLAFGWAAASLPRRDGMIWAATIVAIACATGVVRWRSLLPSRDVGLRGWGPVVLVGASTAATLAWALSSDTPSSQLLVATPLLPVIGAAVHWLWTHPGNTGARRVATVCAGVALAGLVAFGAMSIRDGGFDRDLFDRLVGQTGLNLQEAIGLLGWLDAPLPSAALFVWLLALGALGGAALMLRQLNALGAAALVTGVGVVSAWVLEMNQGNTSGTYWQGRYYLPLLIGVPVIIGWALDGRSRSTRPDPVLSTVVISSAAVVMTWAFAASMRRWAVGTAGSINPLDWDTYGTFVHPALLLAVHAAVAAAAVVLFVRSREFATVSDA